jgi:hypothetical protein
MMRARNPEFAMLDVGPHCGGPIQPCGRELVSVRALLHWAFAVEHAQLDFDDIGAVSRSGYGADSCARVERVDTSIGRSFPHNDAEQAAIALRHSVPWSQAVWAGELCRAGRAPDWDLGPVRVEPEKWANGNRHMPRVAKSKICRTVSYVSRRKGLVKRDEMVTPIVYFPTPAQVAAARRAWLQWVGILRAVLCWLSTDDLELFVLSSALPPLEPWKKDVD